jgi:hypothetical protein
MEDEIKKCMHLPYSEAGLLMTRKRAGRSKYARKISTTIPETKCIAIINIHPLQTRQSVSSPLDPCTKSTLSSPTPISLQKPQPLRNSTPPVQCMFPLQLRERNTISTLHRLIILDTPYTSLIWQRVTLTPGLEHDFSEARSTSSSF